MHEAEKIKAELEALLDGKVAIVGMGRLLAKLVGKGFISEEEGLEVGHAMVAERRRAERELFTRLGLPWEGEAN
ncbi:hypothetical protein [Deinococcus kurensis]|uniref:hypothetical protein n=1 Tax=Deinococcus kurensis TaxID=2662757 RepID=UPI0012D36EF8|nr:hypothetical protein [Deinococcus kurensis]